MRAAFQPGQHEGPSTGSHKPAACSSCLDVLLHLSAPRWSLNEPLVSLQCILSCFAGLSCCYLTLRIATSDCTFNLLITTLGESAAALVGLHGWQRASRRCLQGAQHSGRAAWHHRWRGTPPHWLACRLHCVRVMVAVAAGQARLQHNKCKVPTKPREFQPCGRGSAASMWDDGLNLRIRMMQPRASMRCDTLFDCGLCDPACCSCKLQAP